MRTRHGRPGRCTGLARAATLTAVTALLAASPAARAEDAAAGAPGPSVRLFDRLCYSTMPDIAAVEAAYFSPESAAVDLRAVVGKWV